MDERGAEHKALAAELDRLLGQVEVENPLPEGNYIICFGIDTGDTSHMYCLFRNLPTAQELIIPLDQLEEATNFKPFEIFVQRHQQGIPNFRTGRKFIHYKNSELEYRAHFIAYNPLDSQYYVVYRALYGEELIWVRTLADFTGTVEVEGTTYNRFQEVDENYPIN